MSTEKIWDVLVIGAGVIGVSAGLRLQMEGYSVAVVDRNAPGSGCSSGNAGYLSETGIIPAAALAGLRKLPSMLMDPDGPLVVRVGYIPKFLPWAVAAARNNTPQKIASIISAQAALTRLAVQAWNPLLQEAAATDLIDAKGALIAFRTREALEARMKRIPTWTEHGMVAQPVTAGDVADLEPGLTRDMAGGIFFPRAARCLHPQELSERLAQRIAANGGTVVQHTVTAIQQAGADGVWSAMMADGSRLRAKRVLVACGRWSDDLLRPLGYKFRLEAERGYHLMLLDPGVRLNRPISLGEGNFAVTPMKHGIRLAGTAEFAGTDAPMDPKRSDMLFRLAAPYFPGLCKEKVSRWMGVRPSLPDMIPAIGQATRHSGLYYSFGHNHSGLTQAAISAQLLSDIVIGRNPVVDPTPYRLTRFE